MSKTALKSRRIDARRLLEIVQTWTCVVNASIAASLNILNRPSVKFQAHKWNCSMSFLTFKSVGTILQDYANLDFCLKNMSKYLYIVRPTTAMLQHNQPS